MRRRDLLLAPLAAALTGSWPGALRPAGAGSGVPFDAAVLRQMARALAAKPYEAPVETVPDWLADLKYDGYRNIRFRPERSIWRGAGLFEVQLLHTGWLFRAPVAIHLVRDGRAQRLLYDRDMFSFENDVPTPAAGRDLGFSGFRIHAPINRQDYADEVAVFQGASYFRAVGRNHVYGLSARGLAINTGEPGGEEFPTFTDFWIEQPAAEATSIVVHALLNSPSCAAAYRFTIRPGDATVMAVEATFYPREDIATAGIAPLTSMFLFAPNDRQGFDDYRPAVHDSDGLAIVTSRGEQLWRPLANPAQLQVSAFADLNPVGFGLMQRQRAFADYQDLEARYERRPSLWVEPIGDWGDGAILLYEIPTDEEIHDNIVAFWRPKETLRRGSEYSLTYRLHWTWDRPVAAPPSWVGQTRIGGSKQRRQFVLDFVGPAVAQPPGQSARAVVNSGPGKVRNVTIQPNPETGGWRLAFQLKPEDADAVELRAQLFDGETAISETWLYRWTPDAG
ncbi:MAG: glucan biosynthesis protein G [Alphaproteobacteria bacterium]